LKSLQALKTKHSLMSTHEPLVVAANPFEQLQ
jgi:hypothetical protein